MLMIMGKPIGYPSAHTQIGQCCENVSLKGKKIAGNT